MKGERRALLLSAGSCLLIGGVALYFALETGAEAILLDGLFNITYFLTGLVALRVARLVEQGDDEIFPVGYAAFEPLVNGVKGLLVLGVSLMALAGAVDALLSGGREIELGGAVVYGAIASAVCWAVSWAMARAAERVASPLVAADALNWKVNAMVSSAVLVAFVLAFGLGHLGLREAVRYVDPVVVTAVVALCIGIPVRMAWRAAGELLGRAPAPDVVAAVRDAVHRALSDLSVRRVAVRVLQPGRTREVVAHVLLEPGSEPGLTALDAARDRVADALAEQHPRVLCDVVFTLDERWFAALGRAD